MAITHYVKAVVSEFKGDDGQMKKRYQTIGVVMETKHGPMLKLETLPLYAMKEGGLLAYLNPPEEKGSKAEQAPSGANLGNIEEDIPF